MPPKISVIICTYNRAKFLPGALDSALAQNYKDFEIIVMDDASTDDTEAVMRPYLQNPQVRYYKNDRDLGIARSRNAGVARARGEYIAMLDSDDRWTDRQKLAKQAAILDAHPDIGLVGSNIAFVKADGSRIRLSDYRTADEDIRGKMLIVNQISQSAVLFRKDAFEQAGKYDERLEVAEDYDLWLRIGRTYAFANLAEPTTDYTVHDGNITNKNIDAFYRAAEAIAKKNRRYYPHYWKSLVHTFFRSSALFRILKKNPLLRKIKSLLF